MHRTSDIAVFIIFWIERSQLGWDLRGFNGRGAILFAQPFL